MRLENMILSQLKIGEHQAKCRALVTSYLNQEGKKIT